MAIEKALTVWQYLRTGQSQVSVGIPFIRPLFIYTVWVLWKRYFGTISSVMHRGSWLSNTPTRDFVLYPYLGAPDDRTSEEQKLSVWTFALFPSSNLCYCVCMVYHRSAPDTCLPTHPEISSVWLAMLTLYNFARPTVICLPTRCQAWSRNEHEHVPILRPFTPIRIRPERLKPERRCTIAAFCLSLATRGQRQTLAQIHHVINMQILILNP